MDKQMQATMFSSVDQCWGTPQWLYDLLNQEFSFVLDVAAQDAESESEFKTRRLYLLTEQSRKLRTKYKLDLTSVLEGLPRIELDQYAATIQPRRANFKCANYFSEKDDAFTKQWIGPWFLNSPYGRGIKRWMAEAKRQSALASSMFGKPGEVCAEAIGVCLVPARTDTKWFWDHCIHGASEIRLLKGRVKFEGAESGAPFPSAVVIYRRQEVQLSDTAVIVPWDPPRPHGAVAETDE